MPLVWDRLSGLSSFFISESLLTQRAEKEKRPTTHENATGSDGHARANNQGREKLGRWILVTGGRHGSWPVDPKSIKGPMAGLNRPVRHSIGEGPEGDFRIGYFLNRKSLVLIESLPGAESICSRVKKLNNFPVMHQGKLVAVRCEEVWKFCTNAS